MPGQDRSPTTTLPPSRIEVSYLSNQFSRGPGFKTQMKLLLTLLLATVLDQVTRTAQDDTWRYHMSPWEDHVHKEYVTHEMDPHTSYLCPAGYFISTLSYHFAMPDNFPEPEEIKRRLEKTFGIGNNSVDLDMKLAFGLWRDDILSGSTGDKLKGGGNDFVIVEPDSKELKYRTDDHSKHGPCAPLIYCVGYQACQFRFSIEICRHDPIPNFRKFLKVRLTCAREALWDDYASASGIDGAAVSWHKQTMYLKYVSTLEKGSLDLYHATDISRVIHNKREVFQTYCPDVETAKTLGYNGTCENDPESVPLQSEAVWRNLGRTLTEGCASQLLQVYCAYQYNAEGLCTPPFIINEKDRTDLNYANFPERGDWPDTSSYYKIHHHPQRNLIPARIGFAILGHSAPHILMNLLEMIYRPQHYYVFHIQYKADQTREELQKLIKARYDVGNVRVLPKERSASSTWGAYGIMRAELETVEELLRMGLWDFSIILSGADVPLRSIEDFAASLAAYRGRSFINLNLKLNVTDNHHFKTAWQSCDGHVFRIGQRGAPEDVVFYSHSAFVVLSREACELILSRDRPSKLKDLHFYLSNTFVVDESYFGTILSASHLRNKIVPRGFHFLRHFEPHNVVNLCRHSDVTDACGQGPGDFTQEDLHPMRVQSHHFFFARKFKMDFNDRTRAEMVGSFRDDAYTVAMGRFYPPALLDKLAQSTLPHFPASHQVEAVGKVTSWRIISTFNHSQPCCRIADKAKTMLTNEYKIWVEYSVFNQYGKELDAVATFVPAPTYQCYPGGTIRLFHVTTRADPMDPQHRPMGLNMPLPAVPSGATAFWVQLLLDLEPVDKPCSDMRYKVNADRKDYLQFPLLEEVRQRSILIPTDVTVTDVNGVVHCGQEMVLELGPQRLQEHGPFLWFTHPVHCRNVSAGTWTVTMRQRHAINPFSYSVKLIVVDEQHPLHYKEQVLRHMDKLWRIEEVMIKDKDVDRFYQTPLKMPKMEEPLQDAVGHPDLKQAFQENKDNEHVYEKDLEKMPNPEESRDEAEENFSKGVKDPDCLGFPNRFYGSCIVLLCFMILIFITFQIIASVLGVKTRKKSLRFLTRRNGTLLVVLVVILQVFFYVQLEQNT